MIIAHGVDAAVGQHIQIDVTVLQQERIVPGLRDGLQTIFNGDQSEFLDNADLVHLERNSLSGKHLYAWHNGSLLYLC